MLRMHIYPRRYPIKCDKCGLPAYKYILTYIFSNKDVEKFRSHLQCCPRRTILLGERKEGLK